MEKKEQEELNKKPAKSFMSKFEDTTEDVKITFVNENQNTDYNNKDKRNYDKHDHNYHNNHNYNNQYIDTNNIPNQNHHENSSRYGQLFELRSKNNVNNTNNNTNN